MKIYDYSDAIYSEDLLVYVPKGKSFTFSGIADLKGKKIGTILGWSYGDEFDNAKKDKLFTVEEVNNDLANLKKLALGYLDCVVTIGLTGKQITTQNDLTDKVEALSTPLSKNATYIVFAKKVNKTALITKFNTTMAAMKADGRYDKITQ
jgi:polar amino acid transport system substrate-binding protein